jgi:hypothetical protein
MSTGGQWIGHLRCDSSPQYGKDYLVSEMDVVDMTQLSEASDRTGVPKDLLALSTRLLVIQLVGVRAASSSRKARKLLNALSLESGSLPATIRKIRSILVDLGTESGLWVTPNFESASGGNFKQILEHLFPWALALPDADHGLHHASFLATHNACLRR